MVVCSHPTLGWLFAAISCIVFAPEEMELQVTVSGLALLHPLGLLLADIPRELHRFFLSKVSG